MRVVRVSLLVLLSLSLASADNLKLPGLEREVSLPDVSLAADGYFTHANGARFRIEVENDTAAMKSCADVIAIQERARLGQVYAAGGGPVQTRPPKPTWLPKDFHDELYFDRTFTYACLRPDDGRPRSLLVVFVVPADEQHRFALGNVLGIVASAYKRAPSPTPTRERVILPNADAVELEAFRNGRIKRGDDYSAYDIFNDRTGARITLFHASDKRCRFFDQLVEKKLDGRGRYASAFRWMPAGLENIRAAPDAITACLELGTAIVGFVLEIPPGKTLSDDEDFGYGPPLTQIVEAYRARETRNADVSTREETSRRQRDAASLEYETRGAESFMIMGGAGFGYYTRIHHETNYGLHFLAEGRMAPDKGVGLWAQANVILGAGEGKALNFYGELAGQVGYGFATKYFTGAPLFGVALQSIGPAGKYEAQLGGVAEIRNGTNEYSLRAQGLKCLGAWELCHDEVSVMLQWKHYYFGVRRFWFEDHPDDAIELPGDNFLPDRSAWYLTFGYGGAFAE